MKRQALSILGGGLLIILFSIHGFAQEKKEAINQTSKENYLIGEEQNLEIIVHIWGEVKSPGEKRVPDGTNIMELISKAGGPSEYSNLSKVSLFSNPAQPSRSDPRHFSLQDSTFLGQPSEKFILEDSEQLHKTGRAEIDINRYLKSGKSKYLPRLMPGDVIHVKRNVWYRWQTFIRVASQVAIIAQVWYWYSRIE